MNAVPPPPPSEPQLPARRPYGSVTLPTALPVPRPLMAAPTATGHRQMYRVRLPLLSIAALRADRRP